MINQNDNNDSNNKCTIDPASLLFDPVESNGYQAYAKTQDNKNYMILCKSGQEIIVDQGDAEYNDDHTNINEVKKYDSLKFSPQGTFLIFTAARWEWGSYYIYDIKKNKLIFQSDSILEPGFEFTQDDQYAYYCGPRISSADDSGLVYKTQNFDLEHSNNLTGAEFDIHSLYDKKLLDVQCSYNQLNNSVIFNVTEPDGLKINPATRKFYEYSLSKKEIIKEW